MQYMHCGDNREGTLISIAYIYMCVCACVCACACIHEVLLYISTAELSS